MTIEQDFADIPIKGDNTIPDHGDGIKAITALALKTVQPEIRTINVTKHGMPDAVVLWSHPATGEIRNLRHLMEDWREKPAMRKGTACVETLQSFIDLTNRHKTEHTVIFGKADTDQHLVAIVDYHETTGAADNGQHRVLYKFPLTPEFVAWRDSDNTAMGQQEFAAFLEEHAAELASPTVVPADGGEMDERQVYEALFKTRMAEPNELLDLSRGLEIHSSGKVKQIYRHASGESQVEFIEEHTGAAGERVNIPGVFMVSVQPFVDSRPVRVPARLRYRLREGKVIWWFSLYRMNAAVRARVQGDMAQAATACGLPAFEGTPEMPGA